MNAEERWILEYACRHKMHQVLHVLCKKYPDGLDTFQVAPVYQGLAALLFVVTHWQLKDFQGAMEILDVLYIFVEEVIPYTLFSRLMTGLRTMHLFHLLKTKDEDILAKLNEYFPRNGRELKIQRVLHKREIEFRKLFISLVADEDRCADYLKHGYREDFGQDFKDSVRRLVNEFVSKIEEILPPTTIDMILAGERPSMRDLSTPTSENMEIVLDLILSKEQPTADDFVAVLEEMWQTEHTQKRKMKHTDISTDGLKLRKKAKCAPESPTNSLNQEQILKSQETSKLSYMVQSKNGQLRSPTSENSDGVSQDTQNETYTYTDFNSAHPKQRGRGSFIKTDSKPKDMPAANLQTGFKRLKDQSELQTSEDRQVIRRHFSPNSNQSKKSNSESEDYTKRSLPNANTFSRGPERNKRHLDSEKTETNRSPQGILKPVDNIEMSQESSSSSASQSLLPVPKVSPGDKRDFIVMSSSDDTGCLGSDSLDPQGLTEKNSGEGNAADTQVYLISSSSEEMVLSQERDLSHQPLQESRTQQPNMKASKSQVSSSLVSQVHPDLPSKDKQTDGKVELANDISAEVTSEEEEGESNDTSSIGDSAGQQLLSYVIEESDVEEDEDKASDVLPTTSTQSFTQFDAILEDCHVKQQVVSEKKSHLPKLERHLRPENTRLCVVKIQRDEALDDQLNNNSDSMYS